MKVKGNYRFKSITHDIKYRVVNQVCNDGIYRDRLQMFDEDRQEWVYSNKDVDSKFFHTKLERID